MFNLIKEMFKDKSETIHTEGGVYYRDFFGQLRNNWGDKVDDSFNPIDNSWDEDRDRW